MCIVLYFVSLVILLGLAIQHSAKSKRFKLVAIGHVELAIKFDPIDSDG